MRLEKNLSKYKFRKENGLCTHCGGTFDSVEHDLCKQKSREKRNKANSIKLQEKLHTGCGRPFDSEEHLNCKNNTNIKNKLKRDTNKKENKCWECGSEEILTTRCKKCTLTRMAYKHKITLEALTKLIENQNNLDYYTGEILAFNAKNRKDTASIDHDIPVSRGGVDKISNYLVTSFKVNQIKRQLTKSEFLAHCLLVVKNENPEIYKNDYYNLCLKITRYHNLGLEYII